MSCWMCGHAKIGKLCPYCTPINHSGELFMNSELRRAIAEINVDDDKHPEGNLQYVLIRGFSALGWSQPTNASNDVLDAIVALVAHKRS